MVATRGRTFKRPWRRSCLSSKLKSSSAPIGRKDSWCFHAVGSSNAPLLGSTAAEGLPRIGRTSIAPRWLSCGLPKPASCSEIFVPPPDFFGQTLRKSSRRGCRARGAHGRWCELPTRRCAASYAMPRCRGGLPSATLGGQLLCVHIGTVQSPDLLTHFSTFSCQASAEHFQQCADFLPLH